MDANNSGQGKAEARKELFSKSSTVDIVRHRYVGMAWQTESFSFHWAGA